MICEECRSCPIQDLCDEADRIIDERIGLDGEHDILLAIYEKGMKDAIDEFANWLVKKGILGSRCIYNGEITDYGKVYTDMFLKEKKGEAE